MAFLDIEPRRSNVHVTDEDLASGRYGPDYYFDVKNKTLLREKLLQVIQTTNEINIKPEDYETGNPWLSNSFFEQHGLNNDWVSIMEGSEINTQKLFRMEAKRYPRISLLDTNMLFCLLEHGRESHRTLVKDTGESNLLSNDQKKELGDDIRYAQLAHSQLICRNIPLAINLAYEWTSLGDFYRDIRDMISVANLNLIDSVDRFSFRYVSNKTLRPGRFSTYAYRTIELGFIEYIDKTTEMSVVFSIEDIVGRQNADIDITDSAYAYFMIDHSFEGNPRNSDSIIDVKNKVRGILDMFNHDDQKIIALRFGIGEEHEMTPEEVAAVLGISEERVKGRLREIISICQRKYVHSQK